MDKFISSVEQSLEKLSKKVYDKVEQLARKAMREDDKLLSFCMAMGSASFEVDTSWCDEDGDCVKRKEHLDFCEIDSESKALAQLRQIEPLMDDLNIKGWPLKIDSKDAPSQTDW